MKHIQTASDRIRKLNIYHNSKLNNDFDKNKKRIEEDNAVEESGEKKGYKRKRGENENAKNSNQSGTEEKIYKKNKK